jgi:hypothetical protein
MSTGVDFILAESIHNILIIKKIIFFDDGLEVASRREERRSS